MNNGITFSLMLHACIVLLLIFGVPVLTKHDDVIFDYAVTTEIVTVSELTNLKVKSTDNKSKEESQTKKAPKSVETESVKSEEAKVIDDNKAEEAEKIPDKNKKKEDKKQDKQDSKKNQREDKKNKKKEDDFAKSILKSLESDKKNKSDDKKIEKEFKELEDAVKGETNKEFNANIPMSISEIDAIKSQVARHWNTTAFSGAPEAKDMQVILFIQLDMEANVMSVVPKNGLNGSPFYRAFVESAVRAVKAASPLQNLPKDKYHMWKEIEFRFDASGMIY